MKKQITAHWIDGWTIKDIATKHNVSVYDVVNSIREFWM